MMSWTESVAMGIERSRHVRVMCRVEELDA